MDLAHAGGQRSCLPPVVPSPLPPTAQAGKNAAQSKAEVIRVLKRLLGQDRKLLRFVFLVPDEAAPYQPGLRSARICPRVRDGETIAYLWRPDATGAGSGIRGYAMTGDDDATKPLSPAVLQDLEVRVVGWHDGPAARLQGAARQAC